MTSVVKSKWVSLQDWAAMTFEGKPPHINTLRNWINAGRITPCPKKFGKSWFVQTNAEYKDRR